MTFDVINGRYLNVAFKARINNTICPLITAGCVILCLFASLSDLTAHEAYWEDIVVGWLMGVCTAIYMVRRIIILTQPSSIYYT